MRSRIAVAVLAAAAILFTAPGIAGAGTHHSGWGRKSQPTIAELAAKTPDLSILVQAVQKAGLAGVLADRKASLTVFAPTNEAFVALLGQLGVSSLDDIPVDTLKGVLLDHVLGKKASSKTLGVYDFWDHNPNALGGLRLDYDRSPAMINDANIVKADIKARNGYVHVIDKVLLDPDPRPTIAQLAVGTPTLSILVQAVQKAGLLDAISDPNARLTVFAPTNDAFVALLGKLGVASLDDIPVETLKAVLLDHVVPRELDAVSVLQRAAWCWPTKTLGDLKLNFNKSPLQVNGVNIVATDIEASNGTVHVIDQVLLAK